MTQLSISIFLENMRVQKNEALKSLYRDYRQSFIDWAKPRFKCQEEDSIDAFQEAVIILYRNVIEGKLVDGEAAVKTYLFAIGKNLLLTRLKKTQKVQLHEHLDDSLLKKVDLGVYGKMELEHQQIIISKAISRISRSCQKILQLFYYERYRAAEISEELGYKNEDVVRAQKLRCINQLRKLIKRKDI